MLARHCKQHDSVANQSACMVSACISLRLSSSPPTTLTALSFDSTTKEVESGPMYLLDLLC